MARTALRVPAVVAAWNAQVPIEVDTDTHAELAEWQQERFATQNRPLYVRIDPDGKEERWSRVFTPEREPEVLERFLGFLAGGGGADIGGDDGLGGFLLLALLGGLFTLVMPCTYPMIPFTINFFAKQAASGHRFRGQVMTSLAQGAATTVGLLIASVPGALLWGSVAAILSLLPMVGAAVVWVPATIYLGIQAYLGHGSWGWCIFMALWGVLVVSMIDNVVRPWVMRGRAELPRGHALEIALKPSHRGAGRADDDYRIVLHLDLLSIDNLPRTNAGSPRINGFLRGVSRPCSRPR
jgi:hypothetical protein